MDDLQTRIKQATRDARAARLARGPRGELLTCHQIEDLVGEVYVRINSLLDLWQSRNGQEAHH